jgi:Xaa-Pro aminopeptidase
VFNQKNLCEARIGHLQEQIALNGFTGAILFYSRDILYYTGTAQPSYFVVFPDEYFLFVRSGFDFVIDEVAIKKDKIIEEGRLEKIKEQIKVELPIEGKIGTELDLLPANRFSQFKKVFSESEFVNLSPIILEQRKQKDAYEIEMIKEACKVIDAGHEAVLSNLKEGMTELELAACVEHAHRLAGHEGIFFIRQPDFFMSRGPLASSSNLFRISGVVYTITGVGLSSAVPAGPSRKRIERGDLILVDIPVLVNGYHADQTRMYVLGANDKAQRLFDALKEISNHLVDNIEIEMKYGEIFQMAVEKAKGLNVEDYFLRLGNRKAHFVGHGIGLELNEPPLLSNYDHSKVSSGVVVTLEMHMMSKNCVVKLEDMLLIGEKKNKILSITPRELFQV